MMVTGMDLVQLQYKTYLLIKKKWQGGKNMSILVTNTYSRFYRGIDAFGEGTLHVKDIVYHSEEEFRKNREASLIIITHTTGILSALHVDRVHVLVEGRIVAEGDASLIDEINRDGYRRFEEK